MFKIDPINPTKIALSYSKHGVNQQAVFLFTEGKLVTREFHVNYGSPVTVPDHVTTFRELLRFMRDFTYRGLHVSMIDNNYVSRENRFDKTEIDKLSREVREFKTKVAKRFFNDHILPVIRKRNWFFCPSFLCGQPVVARIGEDLEYESVPLRNKTLERLNKMCSRFESDCDLNRFMSLFMDINELEELGIYKQL